MDHPSNARCVSDCSSLNSSLLSLSEEPLGLAREEGERLPLCVVSAMGKNEPFHGNPGLGAVTIWNRWLARYEIARH